MSGEFTGPGAGQPVKDPAAREERLAVHDVRSGAWGGVPGRTETPTRRPQGSPAGE